MYTQRTLAMLKASQEDTGHPVAAEPAKVSAPPEPRFLIRLFGSKVSAA